MTKERVITVEAPDTTAKIDFLTTPGCTVTAQLETDVNGATTIYVVVIANDDRCTILGTILEKVPQ